MVPTPGRAAYDLDRISRHLDAKVGGLIEMKLVLRDEIPPMKSGKKPMVIQEIPNIDQIIMTTGHRVS